MLPLVVVSPTSGPTEMPLSAKSLPTACWLAESVRSPLTLVKVARLLKVMFLLVLALNAALPVKSVLPLKVIAPAVASSSTMLKLDE